MALTPLDAVSLSPLSLSPLSALSLSLSLSISLSPSPPSLLPFRSVAGLDDALGNDVDGGILGEEDDEDGRMSAAEREEAFTQRVIAVAPKLRAHWGGVAFDALKANLIDALPAQLDLLGRTTLTSEGD